MTTNSERFVNSIHEAAERMELGIRQRIASGELEGWSTCACGTSLQTRYMPLHLSASPKHVGFCRCGHEADSHKGDGYPGTGFGCELCKCNNFHNHTML